MLNRFRRGAQAGIRRLRRDRASTAAMEFAFVAPIVVIIALGVYEICNAVIIYEEVQNAAHSIPASASNLAVQSTGATALSYPQIQLAESEVWAEIPELRSGFESGSISVSITSVTFLKTLSTCAPTQASHSSCNYTPTVAWSVAYTGGDATAANVVASASTIRSCTGAPSVSGQTNAEITTSASSAVTGGLNNETPQSSGIKVTKTAVTWNNKDLTSLPTYVVAEPDPNWAPPSPILVVDVHMKYTPVFGLFLQNGIDFYGTGLYPVRSVQAAQTTTTNGTTTTTALTASQQYTTILNDANTDGATQGDITNGTIPGATAATYCINTNSNLSPAAQS
jgi:Flp pilus assembly protein TadG